MLKLLTGRLLTGDLYPAAFRRLCVETMDEAIEAGDAQPAAFRRLCVETLLMLMILRYKTQPPSGGCVLKHFLNLAYFSFPLTSRLQAAVC